MSLGVAIKGPEGIVLAADSRVTLQAAPVGGGATLPIFYDNATKLLSFSRQRFVGAVTYGMAVIGNRTAHSFLPEFEVELPESPLSVREFAERLSAFFLKRWQHDMPKDYAGPAMTFVVGGFDEGAAYGEVHLLEIPFKPDPQERTNKIGFGMTWGGQLDIVSRIFHGFDPGLATLLAKESGSDPKAVAGWLQSAGPQLALAVPFEFLPLQDCINLAAAVIRTTAVFQNIAVRMRGVGGPTDIAVITRAEGLKFVQRKKLTGELGYALVGGDDDGLATEYDYQRNASQTPRLRRPRASRRQR